MTIRVSATEPLPTHHIKLTDGVNNLGLILCDGNGNANPRAFTRNPLQRTSIKMYQQFACRVNVLPHADWNRLKWGFNALALYDESIERQKVFLEAQYGAQPQKCDGAA